MNIVFNITDFSSIQVLPWLLLPVLVNILLKGRTSPSFPFIFNFTNVFYLIGYGPLQSWIILMPKLILINSFSNFLFLLQQDVLGLYYTFHASGLSEGEIILFTVEWYLETKTWWLYMFTAADVSLLLGHLKRKN